MAPSVKTTEHPRRRLMAIPIMVALAITSAIAPVSPAAADSTDAGSAIILEATNEHRADKGVPTLSRVGLVDSVAQRWAEQLRTDRRLTHNPDYSAQMPMVGRWAAGENVALACGQGGAAEAAEAMMNGWFKSDGHRKNIENSHFTHIGIGFAYNASTDCGYGVQNFGGYAQEFFDVPRSHHFYDEIKWLADSGITTGWSDGTFRPLNNITREQMAAFLYRLAGSPQVSLPADSPFVDVTTQATFYKEIVWLERQGITTGWSDGTFRPLNNITREQMAAFLYRYSGEPAVATATATKFDDIHGGAPFLTEISWLAKTGITTGYADNTFRPRAAVTRETMAAFIERAAAA